MWLHVPTEWPGCRSAQESEGLSSELILPAKDLESSTSLWAVSSGKPSLRPLSWHGWKTRGWMRRLYGTISNPSRASYIAGQWILSLPASHASRGALREHGAGPQMSGGSGPSSLSIFARLDPATSSWKTSQVSFLEELNTYSQTWPRAGSMRSGMCSARSRSVPLTGERDSSSWPTPIATISSSGFNKSGSANAKKRPHLATLARKWSTPTAHDGRRPGADIKSTQGKNLSRDAANWATPTSAEAHRGGGAPAELRRKSPNLSTQAVVSSRQEETAQSGAMSDPALNPRFVEWLMGFPIGWTDCELSATELSHWRLRMLSALSGLA